MTSFSPAFEPDGGDAEVEARGPASLAPKRAVLRLALLGDVHRREHLEDVDHGVAGGPVERLGGVEDAVDPVADRKLLGGRLQVDVGGAPEHGVVDQLLGGHVRPRFLGLRDPRRIFLGRPLALADEVDRRAGPVHRADVLVEQRLHSQLDRMSLATSPGDRASAPSGRRGRSGCGRRCRSTAGTKYARSSRPKPDADRSGSPGHRHQPEHAARRRRRCSRSANLRLFSSLVSCSTQSVVQAQSR